LRAAEEVEKLTILTSGGVAEGGRPRQRLEGHKRQIRESRKVEEGGARLNTRRGAVSEDE
jgi:hypothetical protein